MKEILDYPVVTYLRIHGTSFLVISVIAMKSGNWTTQEVILKTSNSKFNTLLLRVAYLQEEF